MLKKILLGSFIINICLLLGRFSGFIREVVVANIFGISEQADIVIVLLSLPDILLNILVGGALSAALIPVMVSNIENARKITFQSSLLLGIIFFVFSIILSLNSGFLVDLFAPGFSIEQRKLAIDGVKYAVLSLPVVVMTGAATAYLQSKEKFTIPSLGTLFFNTTIVLTILVSYLTETIGLHTAVIAVLAAGLVRYSSQLIASGISFSPVSSLSPWFIDKALMLRYIQAMTSGSVLFLYPVIARSFSSYHGEGSLATFNYSMRLVEFPLLLTASFLSIIFLPKLAKAYNKSINEFVRILSFACQIVLILSPAASSTLISGAKTYAGLVYGFSLFPEDVSGIAALTKLGLMALPFQGLSLVLFCAFNASKKTHIPLCVNLIGIVVLFTLLSMDTLSESLDMVMIALSITYVVIFSINLFFARSWILSNDNLIKWGRFLTLIICINVFFGMFQNYALSNFKSLFAATVILIISGVLSITCSVLVHPVVRKKLLVKLKRAFK